MKLSKFILVSALAVPILAASPILGASAAWADAVCTSASYTVYTTSGFSCNFDGLDFSNFTITPTVSGGGIVTLSTITPVNPTTGEFGLQLDYSAFAPQGGTADVAWSYQVTGNLIDDAYLALSGVTTGTGIANVGETLTAIPPTETISALSLSAPGATSETFGPVAGLSVLKDQFDFGGSTNGSSSSTSILTNAFSLTSTPVPEPASLSLLGTACIGLGLLGRRRKRS